MAFFISLLWIFYDWEEAMDSLDNMLIPIAITGIIFPLFHLQRLKYLDMANMAPPEFKDVRKRVFNFDSGRFDYKYFLDQISETYRVSRENQNSLKLRTKYFFRHAIGCAFLRFDKEVGHINVYYYSIPGYTRGGTRAVEKLDKTLEELIRRSLNS
ncbi:hypothetical protein [Marinilabilia salmonicolor]|nr:hypothetical protein [Marinilabilia salmonicolor]